MAAKIAKKANRCLFIFKILEEHLLMQPARHAFLRLQKTEGTLYTSSQYSLT
jgi:hypothetical protein